RHVSEDRDSQLAVPDPVEYLAGALKEVFPGCGIVEERRARQVERALLIQDLRVDRRDRAARLSEENHHSAASETVQALLEGGLSDRVVNDLDAFSAREFLDFGLELLRLVIDCFVCSRIVRDPDLLGAAGRGDHPGAAHLRDLAEKPPYPSRRGVDETGVSLLQGVRRESEVVRRHALENRR